MNTLVADLEAVRDLLTPRANWLKNLMYAHRCPETGFIDANAPKEDANCWCLIGAIEKAVRFDRRHKVREALRDELGVDDDSKVWEWNDVPGRTHDEVLALLNKVIANEQA